jgi:hypothetical protein
MISLGTMFGGWRIVKTMGTKITKLQPIGGFSAEDCRRLFYYWRVYWPEYPSAQLTQ